MYIYIYNDIQSIDEVQLSLADGRSWPFFRAEYNLLKRLAMMVTPSSRAHDRWLGMNKNNGIVWKGVLSLNTKEWWFRAKKKLSCVASLVSSYHLTNGEPQTVLVLQAIGDSIGGW